MNTLKRKNMMAAYDGFTGSATLAAVMGHVPAELWDKLTGREIGLMMSACNKAYHQGRASTGAELIDGDLLFAGGRSWPLSIAKNLTTTTTTVTTWVPTVRRCMRGGDNDKYVCRDGKYVRLSSWEADQTSEQLYYKNTDTHTIVRYNGVEIERLPYCA